MTTWSRSTSLGGRVLVVKLWGRSPAEATYSGRARPGQAAAIAVAQPPAAAARPLRAAGLPVTRSDLGGQPVRLRVRRPQPPSHPLARRDGWASLRPLTPAAIGNSEPAAPHGACGSRPAARAAGRPAPPWAARAGPSHGPSCWAHPQSESESLRASAPAPPPPMRRQKIPPSC